MKKLQKALVITGATAALGLAAWGGVGVTHAATTAAPTNPMTSLVNAIATKFNLKPSDVQAVVDQQQSQTEAQEQQNEKARLDAAVQAGKLTQDQENLITAKQAEQQTFRQSLQSLTPTQRQTALQNNRTALQQWAAQNNIPIQYVHLGRPHRGLGGPPPTSSTSN